MWLGLPRGMASEESDFLHNHSGLQEQVFKQTRQKIMTS